MQIEEKQTEKTSKDRNVGYSIALLGITIAFVIVCIGTAAMPIVIAYMLHNWMWLFLYPGLLAFISLVGTFG